MLGFLESPKKVETQTFTLEEFKGKATIVKNGDVSQLFSYDTNVANFHHSINKMQVKGYYSPTTARHINAFLEFYGFDRCTKKQLENYEI